MPALVDRIRRLVLATARRLAWLPPTVARVSIGWIFVLSGWGKLHHLPRVVAYFQSLGIPATHLQAPLVATIELVCGAAVLLGVLTRVAVLPLVGTMVVAIVTARWADVASPSDFFMLPEYLLLVLFAWLAVAGAGPLSVDRVLDRWWQGRQPEATPVTPGRASA
jgi:putative oxidoreductase